jgi:uncharacterized protein (DUF433 family)
MSATKKAVSFRFDPYTVEHLKQHTKLVKGQQAELAERYINEGLRQDEHPLIHFREGASGRRPALLGSRLDVADVITTIRQNENSIEQTAGYLEVPVEQVQAAADYYADYREEVDDLIERSRALADRERDRQRRQQEALS